MVLLMLYLFKVIEKRVRDLAFCYPEISFSFNTVKISTKESKTLLDSINPNNIFAESTKVRFGICPNVEDEFQALGFVNGCETNTGSHINYATGIVANYLREFIKKKHKIEVKPADIKNHITVLLS